ncbi:BCCT family transporter [Celeribacter halophilus]|uniref:Betaine/carnitine transporter, BCCT family n=1 Tax=Celeribacter halophilus TaxID=576117 RepID=A0A1I3QZG9_9RHOB|nr:BCCT family transporter [Celeribacter halophilus]PZX13244.1 BCCT family betaine/carnitine transporter [Celeribacter halophilus]SFJ38547.1 betaine/carnitine transporter, BCCT family [Celeribacter halophilus]
MEDIQTADPKVDKLIFGMAFIVILAFATPLVLWPAEGKALLGTALSWVTKTIGWMFLWFAIGALAVLLYFAFGKYANVRFGGAEATPEFSTLSWIAMLFCAGIGSSVMYWGTIEWAYYYAGPPFGVEPKSKDALEWAGAYGLFHWGVAAWSIYCLPALPLGYALWNRTTPSMRLSTACSGVIGHASEGFAGKLIDVMFMFGLIGGISTTIGLGTPMLSAGLSELLGIERTFMLDAAVICVWGGLFGFSVYTGLDKGIRILSDINVWLVGVLLGCAFLFGPKMFQLDMLTNSIGLFFEHYLSMSFNSDPVTKAENILAAQAAGETYVAASGTFSEWWTMFYWAWWIAYAPFMGLFVARISRGRTFQQLIAAELVAGTIGCWLFFAVLGNTSMFFQLDGTMDVNAMIANGQAPEAIIQTIKLLGDRIWPLGWLLVLVFVVLAFIFGATTMDSSAYTLAAVASQEDGVRHEPARWHRFLWAIVLACVALSLLYVGGKDTLSALQSASVVVAVPLVPILVMSVISLFKWLREDFA